MKKIIFTILIILVLSIFAGIFYLNEVVIPTKLKRLVTEEIEAVTGKKVLLQSLRFSIFKGVVLKGLVLYDDTNVLVNIKEASCMLLVMPVFRKEIIIPIIRLESPTILLERRADNSINLLDLFNQKYAPKHGYSIIIHKIRITGAQVNFVDETLTPKYTKDIKNLNIYLYLSLPSKARFDLDFEIPSESPIRVNSSGEYDIMQKKFAAKVVAKDISLKEFSRYYDNLGISIPEGKTDAVIDLALKDDIITAETNGQSNGLVVSKDKILAKADFSVKGSVRYLLKDRQFEYSGNIKIDNMGVSGLEYVEKADDIKGDLKFANSGISSDNISARIFCLPVEIKINLAKLDISLLDIYLASNIKLDTLQTILKDKFKIKIPAELEGDGRIYLTTQYKMPITSPPEVRGSLDMANATINIEKGKRSIEKVNGTLQFEANRIIWSGIDFDYLNTAYKTSGTLSNFDTPEVQIKLSSKDLSLESVFAVNDKLVTFAKFAGRYMDSDFSLTGGIDLSSSSAINADIAGSLDVNISDLKTTLKNFKDKLERMRAIGSLHADFNLNGDMKDIKFCVIEAKILSSSISLYGLKPTNIIIDYYQKDGFADMPRIHSFLYGGTLDAVARINLAQKDNPYSISADIKDVMLEKLKIDTGFGDKDVSGFVRLQAKVDGLSNNLSSLTGSGKLAINNGKLWQLNLFKGLGVLLFTSDFSEVLFKRASASFIVKDKAILTDGFWLKSDLIDMYGSARIGFDNSINASLKAEITDEALESGARKNITTAIGKYTLIDVKGTLKEPKYTLKPDIGGIIGDLQSAVF